MRKMLTGIGGFVGSSVGWWIGEKFGGIMTAFMVSTVVMGVGMYIGYKAADRYEV